MKELKCPKCGNVFSVDEADYASIVSQVRNVEFEEELRRRLGEMRGRQEAEQKAKDAVTREDFGRRMQAKELEISSKDQEISRLKTELQSIAERALLEKSNAVLKARDEMKDSINAKEKEISELKNDRSLARSQAELEKKAIREEYEAKLRMAQEQVDYYKDMKIRMSTKMVGESLEAHCANIFNGSMRPMFPNAFRKGQRRFRRKQGRLHLPRL